MHKTARFTTSEFRAYSEGYYWGVTYALRVTIEAIRRVEELARLAKQFKRTKRSA